MWRYRSLLIITKSLLIITYLTSTTLIDETLTHVLPVLLILAIFYYLYWTSLLLIVHGDDGLMPFELYLRSAHAYIICIESTVPPCRLYLIQDTCATCANGIFVTAILVLTITVCVLVLPSDIVTTAIPVLTVPVCLCLLTSDG